MAGYLTEGFSTVDYAVLILYILAMVGVGFYFSGEQKSSKDFFLAGRSLGWFPVGISLMATLLSAMSYTGIPGETYFVGFLYLLHPIVLWTTLPLMWKVVIPIYYNLSIFSIYEYLEMRYSVGTRMVASVVFVIWRLFWLGGVLYAPCKVLIVAAGLDISTPVMLIILGTVGTLYTFLGGMKAVIWTDVIQAFVMVGGLILVIASILLDPNVGGVGNALSTAAEFGRTQLVDVSFSLEERWTIWAYVPATFFTMLSFFVADQITAQRFFTPKNLRESQRSYVFNLVSNVTMVPALVLVGTLLFVFYVQNPQQMRPSWVTNVDKSPSAKLAKGDSIVDPNAKEPNTPYVKFEDLNDKNVDWKKLAAEGKILRPNTGEPFASADEFLDAEGNPSIEKLGKRDPRTKEWIVNTKSQDQFMPWYLVNRLPVGVAGLVLAALFAASMSSLDSGLNSIATLMIVDYHRRFGVGRKFLARRLKKPVDQLEEADEIWFARPLVLVIGVAAVAFSMIVSQMDNIFEIMIRVINTFGGPLLAVFLLGFFTRRATAVGAIAALFLGTLLNLWLSFAPDNTATVDLWPFDMKPDAIWFVSVSVLASMAIGYVASLITGGRKSDKELSGLVVGVGKLGIREST